MAPYTIDWGQKHQWQNSLAYTQPEWFFSSKSHKPNLYILQWLHCYSSWMDMLCFGQSKRTLLPISQARWSLPVTTLIFRTFRSFKLLFALFMSRSLSSLAWQSCMNRFVTWMPLNPKMNGSLQSIRSTVSLSKDFPLDLLSEKCGWKALQSAKADECRQPYESSTLRKVIFQRSGFLYYF